ncbi:MAG: hypothetical protein M1833_005838 [Piccolia ochrophora]|nr:MAG: hypothetical protein M1833_005838 [Piccolia ochrophora]
MGNVSSRPDDGAQLFLKDQTRLSIASLTVTNSRKRTLLNITPNSFPSTRVSVKRDTGDDTVVDFIQDPETSASSSLTAPPFLLRLNNDEELNLDFVFHIRQSKTTQTGLPGVGGTIVGTSGSAETVINGLTFAYASNTRDLDNLVTREFHADPNLHKNSNVQLLGDYSTSGSPSVQATWSWTWRPPKPMEDRGGGWRNVCSFLEYDQRAHRLNTLASFSFWVQNTQRVSTSPHLASPGFDMFQPPKVRVASSQSVESRVSGYDPRGEFPEPPSPIEAFDTGAPLSQTTTLSSAKMDVSCQRPGEDMSATEDGPLFRATMKALEQRTGNMRTRMKKVLKRAASAQQAQMECNAAVSAFMESLRETAASNVNAVQPVIEYYFEKIAKEILAYEKQNTANLQRLIIDPLTKLYNIDIKQAEAKKKDFEDESRDYYAYVSRYLGQRQDTLKEKKRAESDSKYQTKRRNFELRRFDYSSFMQDLHGGRKEQEMLSHLTRFADAQAKSYLATAKTVEDMIPQLEALNHEVKEVDKEFQFQRTEREEKRRTLEKSTKTYVEPEPMPNPLLPTPAPVSQNNGCASDSELSRADSTSGTHSSKPGPGSVALSPSSSSQGANANASAAPPSSTAQSGNGLPSRSSGSNKFKGIRDLEEKDHNSGGLSEKSLDERRKEGLLWALSRPGSHVDPKGLNKQAWHKFWIVLDQGKLSEYSNWKQKLDLHMDPIDLRMASVREARNAERRFCFEVITPQFKRVYQATSEEDMNSWISAINNALQSAVEGRGRPLSFTPSPIGESSMRRDIGSVLTGKIPSHSNSSGGTHSSSHSAMANSVYRRTTVGARPTYIRTNSNSFEENPAKLLQTVRDADQGNLYCADCGSSSKTEWVSINLAIVLCIECSGIHRSLGTHISKVRSLTLDTISFTTDIVELLLQVGNRVSNMIWEAKLDPTMKPSPTSSRDQRLKFITSKYVNREYVDSASPTLSRFSSPDENLLASIKKNDLRGALYAVAQRANPNATDRSRNTHAIFLALAAADPAAPPSPATTPLASSAPPRVTTFPMAELLMQNGGEIPSNLPAFPLSKSASLYVEQKSGRVRDGSGDTLGALPNISKGELSPADKARESRLQKRVSAGSRLARGSSSEK